jgi:hypothetical protein
VADFGRVSGSLFAPIITATDDLGRVSGSFFGPIITSTDDLGRLGGSCMVVIITATTLAPSGSQGFQGSLAQGDPAQGQGSVQGDRTQGG